MKIKTKMQLMALLPVIMAVIMAVILFRLSSLVSQTNATVRLADDVIVAVSDLNTMTYEYLAHGGDQAKKNWHMRYNDLVETLARPQNTVMDTRGLIPEIRNHAQKMRASFIELIRMREQPHRPSARLDVNRISEQEITGEFWKTSTSAVKIAITLADISHVHASSLQSKAYLTVVLVALGLAILFGGMALMVAYSVSSSLSEFLSGTVAIRQGNLDSTLTVKGSNELGDFAASFNIMVAELKAWRSALQKEVEEHKKTATSLRESNLHLSDVLIKLKRAQQQAVEQERMQALRQMATGIVHDFNGTLTPIIGTAELMLSSDRLRSNSDEVLESFKLIEEASTSAKALVRSLSEFFRPTAPAKVNFVNLNDVVTAAVALTKPAWKEQRELDGSTVTVITDLHPEAPNVHGNDAQLQNALVPLIINAAEAMPRGGTITIRTRPEGNMVAIDIIDTGEGMNPEVRGRCFEPFFSTKGAGSSGMGLAVAKGIIAGHNGTLSIGSEPGVGTSVTIRLPMQTVPPLPDRHDGVLPPPSGLTVLVVDDEPWARRVIQNYLAMENYIVDTAVDGRDALAKIGQRSFNMVILDRAMPDMNGDETARRIRAIVPGIPIVMLTGFGDIMEQEGDHPAHVDVVLSKPPSGNDLKNAIAKAIAIAAKRNSNV